MSPEVSRVFCVLTTVAAILLALASATLAEPSQTPADISPKWKASLGVGNNLFVAYMLCQLKGEKDPDLKAKCEHWDVRVQGMYEMLLLTGQDLCLPHGGVSFKEVKTTLWRWLNANADRRVQPIPVCLYEALRESYCFDPSRRRREQQMATGPSDEYQP
jgi:hypothetical protein